MRKDPHGGHVFFVARDVVFFGLIVRKPEFDLA